LIERLNLTKVEKWFVCARKTLDHVLCIAARLYLSYVIDQKKNLSWKKALTCDKVTIRKLVCISKL